MYGQQGASYYYSSTITGHMVYTEEFTLILNINIDKKYSPKSLTCDYQFTEFKTHWGLLLPAKSCVTATKNNSDFRSRLKTKQ